MRWIEPFALVCLIPVASLASEATLQEKALAEVFCPTQGGAAQRLTLRMSELDPSPSESYGPLVVVLALESKATQKGQRIWQRIAGDTKGSSQRAHWSALLVCDRKAGWVWLFVATSVSVSHHLNVFHLDLSKPLPRLPSEAELLSGSAFPNQGDPSPVASLRAELESCGLKVAKGEWSGSEIEVTLEPDRARCRSWHLGFDPTRLRFQRVPKEWGQ